MHASRAFWCSGPVLTIHTNENPFKGQKLQNPTTAVQILRSVQNLIYFQTIVSAPKRPILTSFVSIQTDLVFCFYIDLV